MVCSEVGDQHANEKGGDVEDAPEVAEQNHNNSENSSGAGGERGRSCEEPENCDATPEFGRYGPENIEVCGSENTMDVSEVATW